jgi:uncharacterized phiE125 gp8 family phage protein
VTVNKIISVSEDFESGGPTEPATLQEVKQYLRTQGFTADDDSGESEFDYDDDLLTDMITEGRLWVEKFTNIYVVPREITLVLLNQGGNLKFPGPVTSAIVLTDRYDETIDADSYDFIGADYPVLETVFDERTTAVFNAGYAPEDVPTWVKRAILAYIAFHYEHRGDDPDTAGSPAAAAAICSWYRS